LCSVCTRAFLKSGLHFACSECCFVEFITILPLAVIVVLLLVVVVIVVVIIVIFVLLVLRVYSSVSDYCGSFVVAVVLTGLV
jgi:hypothetical protein